MRPPALAILPRELAAPVQLGKTCGIQFGGAISLRTFGTGVADALQYVAKLAGGNASLMMEGEIEGSLARVRVRPVFGPRIRRWHPFPKPPDRPAAKRPDGVRLFLRHQHRDLSCLDESFSLLACFGHLQICVDRSFRSQFRDTDERTFSIPGTFAS